MDFSRCIRLGGAFFAFVPTVLGAGIAGSSAFAAEPADCKLVKLMSVDMATLSDGRATLPVTLGERPSALLLDTGGHYASLYAATIEALGITPETPAPAEKGAKASPLQVVVPAVTLGGNAFKNVKFFSIPNEKIKDGAAAPGYDGMFTPDVVSHVDLELDFAANKASLFLQSHCPGQVVYWPAAAVAVVPFELDASNAIKVKALLDGKSVEAILDTGSAVNKLDVVEAHRTFGVNTDDAGVEKVADLKNTYQKRFKSLGFEDFALSNPMVTMSAIVKRQEENVSGGKAKRETTDGHPPLVIGMSTLRKFHIYMAFGEKKLYLTPATAPAPAPATVPAAQ